MLTVVSGPFHPGLEQAFIERLKTLKKNPLVPVAVVLPSSRLLDRLERLLAEHGISVVNVHFHTLASFSESVVLAETVLDKPLLSDPLFFDTLVKIILKEDRPFEGLADVAVPEGFPPAVRSTLRDLLDAGIDEKNVMEAIREEFAGREVDLGTLRSLLRLHNIYLKKLKTLPVSSRAELLKKAIEMAPDSKWIQSFTEVMFYGFYDMTGNQTDFFQAVVKNFPSSFFFPFVKENPAYVFAKRFRDTFLQPVMREEIVVEGERGKKGRIINISGVRDEAWFVATEISRIHQQEKIPYSKIAVIARARNRLVGALPKALTACDVPYHCSAKESFFDLPSVQAAYELLRLVDDENAVERPAVWPAKDKWSSYAKRAHELVAGTGPHLLASIDELSKFDLLSISVTRREFLETLRERWVRMERSGKNESHAGVSLLHAEAARGLPFEVIFLVGVEERVFPRVIREDPFLRDDTRLALNMTLGHKIGQKMTALEEERLLFEIFTHAAPKLYLTYQRSDDEGAVVGPSSFLRAYMEKHGLTDADVESVQRRALAKIIAATPASLSRQDIVTGLLSAGREKDALAFAKKDGRSVDDLKRGLAAQRALHSFDDPGAFDGLIGKQEAALVFRGGKISPSALEDYGQCPYKYFATRILRLQPKEEMLTEEALPADKRGTVIHDTLENFFREVTKDGKQPLPEKFPEKVFEKVFQEFIGKITAKELNLHPVLWQAVKINLQEALRASVELDYRECLANGFQPAYFEAEVTGALEGLPPEVQWLGKMDRIDVRGEEARVVDYKTGRAPDEKRVAQAALRGAKSQAPLYLMLARNLFDRLKKDVSQMAFVYLYIFDGPQSRVFTDDDWTAYRSVILETIRKQVKLILDGNFIILPGDYCSFCEVKPICRVNHSLSAYRARKGEGEKLWAIREQKLKVKKA